MIVTYMTKENFCRLIKVITQLIWDYQKGDYPGEPYLTSPLKAEFSPAVSRGRSQMI